MNWLRWGGLGLAAGLLALFAYMLAQPKDEFIHSAMIGETIPAFDPLTTLELTLLPPLTPNAFEPAV